MTDFVVAWSKKTGKPLKHMVPRTHLTHPILGADLTDKAPVKTQRKKQPVTRVPGDKKKKEV